MAQWMLEGYLTAAAAILFCVLAIAGALFQLALAAGAPWGRLAMGGKYPGKFPTPMRAAAVVQGAILVLLAVIVLVRGGVIASEWQTASQTAVWIPVAFSALATLANLATPSKWERILWAPVAVLMLATSALVATS